MGKNHILFSGRGAFDNYTNSPITGVVEIHKQVLLN